MGQQTNYNINIPNGFAGQLDGDGPHEVRSAVNADVVSLPAGVMLSMGVASSKVLADQVVLPTGVPTTPPATTAATAPFAGISVHTHAVNTIGLQTETTDLIFQVGQEVGLLAQGRIRVTLDSGTNSALTVLQGDPVYARYVTSAATGTQLGAFSNASDASKNTLIYGAQFVVASDTTTNTAVLDFDLNACLAGLFHS